MFIFDHQNKTWLGSPWQINLFNCVLICLPFKHFAQLLTPFLEYVTKTNYFFRISELLYNWVWHNVHLAIFYFTFGEPTFTKKVCMLRKKLPSWPLTSEVKGSKNEGKIQKITSLYLLRFWYVIPISDLKPLYTITFDRGGNRR